MLLKKQCYLLYSVSTLEQALCHRTSKILIKEDRAFILSVRYASIVERDWFRISSFIILYLYIQFTNIFFHWSAEVQIKGQEVEYPGTLINRQNTELRNANYRYHTDSLETKVWQGRTCMPKNLWANIATKHTTKGINLTR